MMAALVVFALLSVLSLWLLAHWASAAERNTLELPHAQYRLPLLGDLVQVIRHTNDYLDGLVYLSECFHGRSYSMKIPGTPPGIIVSRPELFEDILKTQFESFDRGPFFRDILGDLIGQSGIFGADGAQWVHQRKTSSHLFTMNALREALNTTVRSHFPVLLSVLSRSDGEVIDLARLFSRFTIDTFAEIGFGTELQSLASQEEHPFVAALDGAQQIVFLRFLRPPWLWKTLRWIYMGRERSLKQHIRVIDETIVGIIVQTLKNRTNGLTPGKKKPTLISMFLDQQSAEHVDPTFLRDIVVNFLIAGRDTMAQALSWCVYALTQHPTVEKKLRQELQTKLPELWTGQADPQMMAQVNRLVYLDAVVKETLRLYPSVPANVKHANRDTVLCDGTFVQAGTCVTVSAYVLGRSESVWGSDAKQFRPERWIDSETGKIVPVSPFKFNAFSSGPRKCIGVALANSEIKLVLATVLRRFRLELAPEQQPVVYVPSMTLPMKHPLLVRAVPISRHTR